MKKKTVATTLLLPAIGLLAWWAGNHGGTKAPVDGETGSPMVSAATPKTDNPQGEMLVALLAERLAARSPQNAPAEGTVPDGASTKRAAAPRKPVIVVRGERRPGELISVTDLRHHRRTASPDNKTITSATDDSRKRKTSDIRMYKQTSENRTVRVLAPRPER